MKSKFTEKLRTIVLLFIILFLGAFLRFNNLTELEFWWDEAFTGIMVSKDWGDLLKASAIDIVNPPLYYVVLKIWTSVLGYGDFINTDFLIRSFSAFIGTLSIPLSYFLGTQISKSNLLPLLLAFVVAINPFFIEYSQEARAYSLLMFITLIFLLHFFKILSKENVVRNDWLKLAIIFLLGLLTHYFFGLLLFPILWIIWDKIKLNEQKRNQFMKYTGVAILVLTVLGISWIAFAMYQALQITTIEKIIENARNPEDEEYVYWVENSDIETLPRSAYIFSFGHTSKVEGHPPANLLFNTDLWLPVGTVLIAMYCLFAYLGYKRASDTNKLVIRRLLKLILVPVIIVFAISFMPKSYFLERYLSPYGLLFILSFVTFTYLYSKKLALFLVVMYFVLTLNISVTPTDKFVFIDARNTAAEIASSEGNYVTASPRDYVILYYYVQQLGQEDKMKIYSEEGYEQYKGWVAIDEEDIVTSI